MNLSAGRAIGVQPAEPRASLPTSNRLFALATGHHYEPIAQAAMSDMNRSANAGWKSLNSLGCVLDRDGAGRVRVGSVVWVVVGTQYVTINLKHLGYPLFLATIIGVFDFPGAVTLLIPGFTRLKEWAYAGAFFKVASP
jgi:hypothetical protein